MSQIANACPVVSMQGTVSHEGLKVVCCFRLFSMLSASGPNNSPWLLSEFSARPSSPAARKSIFLNHAAVPAIVAVEAGPSKTDDAIDAALSTADLTVFATVSDAETGTVYVTKRCMLAKVIPIMNCEICMVVKVRLIR